ncbi:MAG: flagellar export chaperone FliS [Ramlibacter sp.]|nr:flagellar export chaperone FliS [Ramlibacter sp.]
MFTTTLQPIQQYRQIETGTAVSEASPHQLVMLLFDGAISAILQARHALETGDMPTKIATVSKAMRIIDEGLKASLESQGEPQLEESLKSLYDHMVSRLFLANLHNSDVPLAEVARLLGELRSAWAAIAPKRAHAHADVRA